MTTHSFDWAELAFSSKRPLSSLKATFITAPREISEARFIQLVKQYLPKGHILLGLSKEDFVEGLDGQPQFTMLRSKTIQKTIDTINDKSEHKVYILHYFQRELDTIIEKLTPPQTVFVNGSWYHSFHTLSVYYLLSKLRIPYELVSAFSDETEALAYEKTMSKKITLPTLNSVMSDKEIIMQTDEVAKQSYDYGFQTGAILAKKTEGEYEPVLSAYNKVVPYQTYALLHGASRETHLSPTNDTNHYDTIHAEMAVLVEAQKQNISLVGTTLFVNLMPCPNCSRTLAETDIAEVVYRFDHSEGYAIDLLQKTNKTVRRIVY
ncbi:MAG: deaminase [Candidatus Microsaccharimonas sp.]